MIKRKQFYVAICDKCEKSFGDNLLYSTELNGFCRGYFGYKQKRDLERLIEMFGWKRKGKKWFCSDCQKEEK